LTSSHGFSRGIPDRRWDIVVYGCTCSCGAILPADLSNRRTDGCATQPLLLSCDGLGVTVARIFSAAFKSLLATNSQFSQTYSPRSTRFESASVPHSQQVFEVFNVASGVRSTSIPRSSAVYSMWLNSVSNAQLCRRLFPCRPQSESPRIFFGWPTAIVPTSRFAHCSTWRAGRVPRGLTPR
jgi:hypothetical protein